MLVDVVFDITNERTSADFFLARRKAKKQRRSKWITHLLYVWCCRFPMFSPLVRFLSEWFPTEGLPLFAKFRQNLSCDRLFSVPLWGNK